MPDASLPPNHQTNTTNHEPDPKRQRYDDITIDPAYLDRDEEQEPQPDTIRDSCPYCSSGCAYCS